MFPYPIAKPQKCDIQTFYGANDAGGVQTFTWNKPVGVSHVYMMLIGAGGNGTGAGTGGGSGAVTVWYGAAQHVPNSVYITPGSAANSSSSRVFVWFTNTDKNLLLATSASGAVAGSGDTPGPFGASGFYKSTAGQDGSTTNTLASSTTFLSGGSNLASSSITANYGYNSTASSPQGYFQMQPIIVGVGASANSAGGIGCGGGGGVLGKGGPGMVLIASW